MFWQLSDCFFVILWFSVDKKCGLELQSEAAALPGDGLYGDVASVAVHNLFAQAKSDAGAVGFGAEEGNEYLVLYVG